MRGFRRDFISVALFLLALLLFPSVLTNDYYVSTLTIACINAIIVVGLNLLLGYAGQISLGHAAFYGIAAYTTSILTTTYGWPVWGGIIAALFAVVVVAYVIGVPSLKLTGHYLAMATLGFGIIVYIFFNETVELTGGPTGFVGIPRLEFFGYTFDSDLAYYYLVASVLSFVVLISLNLINSRVGRALKAIHTSETAAQVMGVNISGYKVFVFVLSAFYAGIAGVLYAHYLNFVAPSSFGFDFSVELVVMVVLGGMASVWGAVVGAFFLTVLPEFLRVFEDLDILIFGAILIACIMFLPQGIAGGVRKLVERLRPGREAESG